MSSTQSISMKDPRNGELQYRTSGVEYFLGVCLWAVVLYGWRRATLNATSADLVSSVGFTVGTVAVNSVLVALWVWSRIKSASRRWSPPALVPASGEMQSVVN